MDDLNVGTKEIVSVDLTDRLGTITNLGIYVVNYRVSNEDGTDKLAWTPATAVNGMRVDCLVDTTSWSLAHYELYVRPTIGVEMPIIGPFDFNVI
jgi:hypothetical protein